MQTNGKTRLTWWFSPEVHLVATKLRPRCVDRSRGGSAANWHHPLSPHVRHPIKCTIMMWLACFFFYQCLHERIIWNTTLIFMTSSLLAVACFSWSILLIASTKHLKCPSDHHFHVSLSSTTLSLSTHRRQAPTLGRSDLSLKNHSWHSLEMFWLIDPSEGLNLMSNLNSFFKSFSFYLFKSISFNQKISNCHQNLNFIFILSLILIFNLSTKCVPSTLHNQMALYSLLIMLLD